MPPETETVFDIKVDYETDQVAVNDLIDIDVTIPYNPPEPIKAGMVVLDVSVPTGFAALEDSLAALLDDPNVKRYDVAGRKVIIYIEDMSPGDEVDASASRPRRSIRCGARGPRRRCTRTTRPTGAARRSPRLSTSSSSLHSTTSSRAGLAPARDGAGYPCWVSGPVSCPQACEAGSARGDGWRRLK